MSFLQHRYGIAESDIFKFTEVSVSLLIPTTVLIAGDADRLVDGVVIPV